MDNAANTTIITGSLDIIADTIPPVTPTLSSFASSGVYLNTATPTLSGTGEPGTTISITNGSGILIADTVVDVDGLFTLILLIALTE